jgi:FMN phosphatase YigB (HAD superfamily)
LPQARQAVEAAVSQGAKIVLATNPVFPRAAVDSRLEWAGLADVEFDWVTSYENSRFCKPSPGYYLDILEQINLEPQQCLMVGNDAREDTAAAALGIDTFLVEGYIVEHPGATPPTWRGSWQELLELLQ